MRKQKNPIIAYTIVPYRDGYAADWFTRYEIIESPFHS